MRKIALLFLMALLTFSLFAQDEETTGPAVRLAYYYDVVIQTPDGEELFDEDLAAMEEPLLYPGSTIVTLDDGTAELEMVPNGTIIRLAEGTNFTIENLAGIGENNINAFKMTTGKFRAVAAAVTGDNKYEFKGNESACGVRGTDFGMEIPVSGGEEQAYVLKGLIDYSRTGSSGEMESIPLGAGQMASNFMDVFQPIEIPPAKLVLLQQEMGFQKLKPEVVNQNREEPTPGPAEEPTPAPTEEPADTTDVAVDTSEPTATEAPGTEEPAEPKEDNALMKWLKEVLGMEIGSVTIDGETYAKAVLQPTIKLGKLKTALYLPIIYQDDMFDPDKWYKPKGNNEWSFGSDQAEGDYLAIGVDFLNDLMLKIKFLQWGEQRDSFFAKVGNVNDFTIGHGLIMNKYANDADFPAIRRIGVNMGLDFEKWGFEALVNDLTEAEIFGTRLYFRPAGKLALGVSVVSDINPAGGLPEVATAALPTAADIGNPMFFNLGFDIDLPIIESDLMSIVLFSDIAGLLPVFLDDATGAAYSNITAGAKFDTLIVNNQLRNFGANMGVFGNILMLKYVVDARYFTGTFKPGFYGQNYDRVSAQYAVDAANYVQDPTNPVYNTQLLGIYGQANYALDKIFSIDVGYMWPLAFSDDGSVDFSADDQFMLTAVLEPGVIPFIELSGSLSYYRTKFWYWASQQPDPAGKTLKFVDEYTILKGEVLYGVSEILDLAFLLSGAVSRDKDTGAILYDDNGSQKMDVSFSIETRVHF